MAEELKQVFEFLDKDKSGYIDSKELAMGLRALGLNPTQAEVDEILEQADTNDDGKLDLQEFQKLYDLGREKNSVSREGVEQFFRQYDRDGSGFLNRNELKEALTNGGEPLDDEEVETLLRDFDKNGDGLISVEELMEALFT